MNGVSIVVVCFNSGFLIEKTLENLFAQKYTKDYKVEILLINNNSTDDTVYLAKKIHEKYRNIDFRIIDELRPGTSFARMKGVEEAQYDVICFIDDDNRVSSNFISKAMNILENVNIGILGCPGIGDFEETPPDWFEKDGEAYAVGSLYPNFPNLDITNDGLLATAGMFLRREIFVNLKKQNWIPYLSGRDGKSQVAGEDSELCQAARLLGYKIWYTNEINFKHYMPKIRINRERFLEMTYAFGVADVFLLPYKLVYEKRINNKIVQYFFRKYWLFNILGKKCSLLNSRIKLSFGLISENDFKKIEARNNGFCDTIISQKSKFIGLFHQIENFKQII